MKNILKSLNIKFNENFYNQILTSFLVKNNIVEQDKIINQKIIADYSKNEKLSFDQSIFDFLFVGNSKTLKSLKISQKKLINSNKENSNEKQIIGIEVKSEMDNLNRLEKQLYVYDNVCDQTFIFCSQKHLTEVKMLLKKKKLEHIGIILFKNNDFINFLLENFTNIIVDLDERLNLRKIINLKMEENRTNNIEIKIFLQMLKDFKKQGKEEDKIILKQIKEEIINKLIQLSFKFIEVYKTYEMNGTLSLKPQFKKIKIENIFYNFSEDLFKQVIKETTELNKKSEIKKILNKNKLNKSEKIKFLNEKINLTELKLFSMLIIEKYQSYLIELKAKQKETEEKNKQTSKETEIFQLKQQLKGIKNIEKECEEMDFVLNKIVKNIEENFYYSISKEIRQDLIILIFTFNDFFTNSPFNWSKNQIKLNLNQNEEIIINKQIVEDINFLENQKIISKKEANKLKNNIIQTLNKIKLKMLKEINLENIERLNNYLKAI